LRLIHRQLETPRRDHYGHRVLRKSK